MARVIVILKERDGMGKNMVQVWPEGTKWGTDKLFNNVIVRTGELWLRKPDTPTGQTGEALAVYADGEWLVVHVEQTEPKQNKGKVQ